MSKFLIAALVLIAGPVQARLPEAIHCAFTNEGFGGEVGSEIRVIKDKLGFYSAVLIDIDPGGAVEYARLEVQKSFFGQGVQFKGTGFSLMIYDELAKTKDGFSFATYSMPGTVLTDQGATLCHGPDLGSKP